MEQQQEQRQFNRRSFISAAMFVAGIALPLSGYMNHLLQFEEMTRERHFWMTVHNVSAILFAIFIILHLTLNWKPFVRYIKTLSGIRISKEALWAIGLVVSIVGIISSHALHVH